MTLTRGVCVSCAEQQSRVSALAQLVHATPDGLAGRGEIIGQALLELTTILRSVSSDICGLCRPDPFRPVLAALLLKVYQPIAANYHEAKLRRNLGRRAYDLRPLIGRMVDAALLTMFSYRYHHLSVDLRFEPGSSLDRQLQQHGLSITDAALGLSLSCWVAYRRGLISEHWLSYRIGVADLALLDDPQVRAHGVDRSIEWIGNHDPAVFNALFEAAGWYEGFDSAQRQTVAVLAADWQASIADLLAAGCSLSR